MASVDWVVQHVKRNQAKCLKNMLLCLCFYLTQINMLTFGRFQPISVKMWPQKKRHLQKTSSFLFVDVHSVTPRDSYTFFICSLYKYKLQCVFRILCTKSEIIINSKGKGCVVKSNSTECLTKSVIMSCQWTRRYWRECQPVETRTSTSLTDRLWKH